MSSVGTATAAPVGSAVPSSGAASLPENKKGVLGKNEFLRLLIAQMKNQDPMSPASGDQMAAQLAQFASLEQLQNINSSLTGQASDTNTLIASIQTTAAMGTLGKTVVAKGDSVEIPDLVDPRGVAVQATIGGSGGNAVLSIMDASGTVVGTTDLGNVNAGVLNVSLGSGAQGLSAGMYHYAINVTDSAGTTTPASTFTTGKVDTVRATANGPVLICGGLAIPFNSVTEIKN